MMRNVLRVCLEAWHEGIKIQQGDVLLNSQEVEACACITASNKVALAQASRPEDLLDPEASG